MDSPFLESAGRVLPDYAGGSIVNLMASIAGACGGILPYAPARVLDVAALADSANLVLVVIDGLGYDYVASRGAGGALHAHMRGRLTSVFPSTTATAITTMMTGLAPQQHGLTGWHMYFSEFDAVIAVLMQKTRGDGRPLAEFGERAEALFPYATLFQQLAVPACVVAPRWIVHTPFNVRHTAGAERRAYDGLADFFPAIAACVRAAPARKFVYAYYPVFDTLAHEHGITSSRCANEFAALDEAFADFLKGLSGSDTMVLVTADHGFIDAPPEHRIDLENHPRLAATLARPLCGERRAAYCYVRPDRRADFEAYVENELADAAWLARSADLVAAGLFGPGAPHPRLSERVGDYTLLMKGDCTIRDLLSGEKRHEMIGVHGGASAAEMYVPLIVARP
ncbi:MAG: alkaline phosphatase family protein [Burkholderiales bacterium]